MQPGSSRHLTRRPQARESGVAGLSPGSRPEWLSAARARGLGGVGPIKPPPGLSGIPHTAAGDGAARTKPSGRSKPSFSVVNLQAYSSARNAHAHNPACTRRECHSATTMVSVASPTKRECRRRAGWRGPRTGGPGGWTEGKVGWLVESPKQVPPHSPKGLHSGLSRRLLVVGGGGDCSEYAHGAQE